MLTEIIFKNTPLVKQSILGNRAGCLWFTVYLFCGYLNVLKYSFCPERRFFIYSCLAWRQFSDLARCWSIRAIFILKYAWKTANWTANCKPQALIIKQLCWAVWTNVEVKFWCTEKTKRLFQRRPKGLSLTITVFRQMSIVLITVSREIV